MLMAASSGVEHIQALRSCLFRFPTHSPCVAVKMPIMIKLAALSGVLFLSLRAARVQALAADPVAESFADSQSVMWDVGPKHYCYAWDGDFAAGCPPLEKDTSGCAPFLTPARKDESDVCNNFTGPTSDITACPLWRFDAMGGAPWCREYFRAKSGPKYDAYASGAEGAPLEITLVNNARLFESGCALYEVALSYQDFPASFLKVLPPPDGRRLTLGIAERFVVEYDVLIESDTQALNSSDAGCVHQRRFLTTDFIYFVPRDASCTDPDAENPDHTAKCLYNKNLLSINHFNPTGTPDATWSEVKPDGCRYMTPGVFDVEEGVLTHVTLDFKALLAGDQGKICHPDGNLTGLIPSSVQIVSSNIASDTAVKISNVNVYI